MSILKRIRDRHKLADALRQRGYHVPDPDTDAFNDYILNLYAGRDLVNLIDDHLETVAEPDSYVFDSPHEEPGKSASDDGPDGEH